MGGRCQLQEARANPIIRVLSFKVPVIPGNSGHLARRPSWKDRSPCRLTSVRGVISLAADHDHRDEAQWLEGDVPW
jgi:hypothetical protein